MTPIANPPSGMREFHPPHTMTPVALGDEVARLIWESFSDFVSEEVHDLQCALGIPTPEEGPDQRLVEEMLIFLMWVHTRAVQLAFLGRVPDERIRATLDSLHEAVFEDLVANGTPRTQLPFFEQRVGARYSEYHEASKSSDDSVGMIALRYMGAKSVLPTDLSWSFTERAVATANPLRDYLEDIELVD